LKHGFRDGDEGEIIVAYESEGSVLSISDNGSGTQEASDEPPHTGLGTSIVETLAHQLEATVERTSGSQGTTVAIKHG
jgi:two-component sensor histidine kinase